VTPTSDQHEVPLPLPIRSGQGDYEVRFHASPRAALETSITGAIGVIADAHVLEVYRDEFGDLLASVPVLELDATEETKTIEGVASTCSWLLSLRANRTSRVVALGGGVIQDVATFAAHIYHRGMRWDFVPTTLLAMSDSCIGAKCGINHDGFKNQLGVFQSPGAIEIATGFLNTLDDVELRSGYGEVFKLCLTHGPEAFEHLEQALRDGLRNDDLVALTRLSLEAKKHVIEEDEYEGDLRRVLNYGQTFGHALEAVSHNGVPHGLAVIWGCDLINFIAFSKGLLAESDFVAIRQVATSLLAGMVPVPAFTAAELIDAARTDKKAEGTRVNLAILYAPGDLRIVQMDFDEDLAPLIARYLEQDVLLSRN
jgi:3-dehydroquinate synthase